MLASYYLGLAVKQTFSLSKADGPYDSFPVVHVSRIPAETKLADIAVQMLLAYRMERAVQAPLQ